MKPKDKPCVVQSDSSILVETDHPGYESARDMLSTFAELVKSPEHIHTYQISPISVWNACAAGLSSKSIIDTLKKFSRYDLPQNVLYNIRDYTRRYGLLSLFTDDSANLVLSCSDANIFKEICNQSNISSFFESPPSIDRVMVKKRFRGDLKLRLLKLGFPVDDIAGYVKGEPLSFKLRKDTLSNTTFNFRDYQRDSMEIFYAGGTNRGGSGIIVLPCGAGKTIVGIGVMNRLKTSTLIITANITALRQWIQELLDKTTLTPDQIGEYSGHKREIKPVTIATYQILVYRKDRNQDFPHFKLFESRNWGLIIYDEVHLLPAPVFRVTADIQARRRLGLTATLIREDGKEDEVFSLIGPKKYDVPWKVLEKQGWIAEAECFEIKLPLNDIDRVKYIMADKRDKFRISSENPLKFSLVEKIIANHRGEQILIIGQYLRQLRALKKIVNAPIITGQTPASRRDELYQKFRQGEEQILIVSKVANFAVDLPDASVAVQISGTFGSRQEEAQRLGRILRPKLRNQASFYSLVSRDSVEQDFATKRQMFLTEQGYSYHIYDVDTFQSQLLTKAERV